MFERQDSTKFSKLVSYSNDPHAVLGSLFGSRYAEYRRRWEAAVRMELELDYPLHVDLETTFTCNLRCPMCVLSLPKEEIRAWGDQDVKMSRDTAARIIDEGAREGQAALGLNGTNEPLLVKWLPEMVRYARQAGLMDVMFNTNGALLTRDRSEALIDAGLTRIMISLDAISQETYDRIRVGSDFQRVLKNIDDLLEVRAAKKSVLPLVRVSFVRMSLNEHELEEFVRTWGARVDFLSIQQYANPFEGGRKTEKESLRSRKFGFDYPDGFRCPQPWVRALVRNDGTINPCCAFYGMRLPMGSIHQQSLKSLWDSPSWRSLRRIHQEGRYHQNPVCRDCAQGLVGQFERIIPGAPVSGPPS
jgi:radical SAM protein with 4Fe4S-binding SPASM domain